jgi:hypothetical protein
MTDIYNDASRTQPAGPGPHSLGWVRICAHSSGKAGGSAAATAPQLKQKENPALH